MSFDVTGLQSYVELKSKEIATKAVGNATTAKLLIDNGDVQVGVKGSAPILKMDADVNFQDGSSCGRVALGSTYLSNATVTVKPIKDVQNFCPKALYDKYYSFALKAGQNPETEGWAEGFAQYVMDIRTGKINEAIEDLLWNGDTSLSTGNRKYINGILKQVTGGAYTNIDSTATTLLAQLQEAYGKMPIKVRKASDFRIFIGEDMLDSLLIELANKNIYKPTDDLTLFGTSARIQPTPGLNGSYKVVMTRLSNLQLGLDLEGDLEKASLKYSMESEQWYMDYHMAVGIAIVYPIASEIGYADLTPA